MAIRTIVEKNDGILRKPTRFVDTFDDKLHELLDDMWETMKKNDGVGLACPQVGVLKRIAIIKVDSNLLELINPKIVFAKGSEEGVEGCLSCPEQWVLIDRATKIKVEYQDKFGRAHSLKADYFLARVIQHELDHLEGILMIDRATRILNSEELEQYLDEELE